MAKRTKAKASEPVEIDPAGEDKVLVYVGPAVVPGIPARDLHGNDLARAAYVRAHRATDWDRRDADGNGPPLPSPATQEELADLVDELVESGAYSSDVPRGTDDEDGDDQGDQPATPATAPGDVTTEQPATPAEG